MASNLAIWTVAALATAGVILRPFGWPEAVWALAGAAVLLAARLISPDVAVSGVAKGTDVYLFLTGMMILSEVAREEGLFDWLAAHATRRAAGSAPRLFLLVYAVGTLVTIFLSNDATAVVLTPAVAAAVATAKAEEPLPYLLVCAFIANAASFVLPISNPANLVIYGDRLPPLAQWLPLYLVPSVVSIVATYVMLRFTQRRELRQSIAAEVPVPHLSRAARVAALGIVATAVLLMAFSALDRPLGLPTAVAGVATALLVLAIERKAPWRTLAGISWGVLPLVAGLFVLVEAIETTGLLRTIAAWLGDVGRTFPFASPWIVGTVVAFASNVVNNLPAGLLAGHAVQSADAGQAVTGAVLVGIDLGPNLSVTGSLATILWLAVLRREGHAVGALAFLRLGFFVMVPALLATLAAVAFLAPR